VSIAASHEDGTRLQAALRELLAVEPELPYANFRPLADRPGAVVELHASRWAAETRALCTSVARGRSGEPLAAVCAVDREFESAHFGLRMAKIEPPVALRAPEVRTAALHAAYGAAVGALRAAGYTHVAARASTRDRAAGWVLQELGFFHVDTQVSWMCTLTGMPHDEALPPELRLEIHDRQSVANLARASWARLATWTGRAFDRGPLVFDHSLPYERALQVYEAWTEKVLTGEWADAVLLVRHGNEVVAFISMLILPDVSDAAGVRVCGRGLAATLPEYRGLFTAIQREMVAARPLGAAFMENETQAATIGSINVYAKLGFRYLRSTSTFHLRLDAPASRR
jgi:hypothetical protein